MRLNVVLRYVGIVMLVLAFFMMLSAGVSLVSGRDSAYYPLLLSTLLTALLGGFPLIFVDRVEQISSKEGYCIVVGAWLLSCFVGTFPYLIWGGEFNLVNAWFESVSGYTTTGASILQDVEALPRGLLFWRSCTSWLGGVGVVMFALLVLPSLGTNKMMLSSVELSVMARHNYRYKAPMIARILLLVYTGITAVAAVALKLAGMNWFDALNHAMSSVATCGFSTKNASVGYFDSALIDAIITAVMFVSSLHFGLIYATLVGQRNNLFRSEVTRFYTALVAVVTLLVTASIYAAGLYPTLLSALRYAAFQVVSLISTTGLATTDTNLWPPFAIVLLIFVSIVCACAGSTAGGLKVDRFLLAIKNMKLRLTRQQHPTAVLNVRVDGHVLESGMVDAAMVFIVAYLFLIFLGTVASTLTGVGLMTSFTASVACISNVGPGFEMVGSMNNYGGLPAAMKGGLTLLMLLGRLEIFGLIQLFFIKWWR